MIDAILDHTCTRRATVAALRAEGGIRALNVSHVANPTLDFDTPSRKIELYSEQAERLGLPPLPSHATATTGEPRTGSGAPPMRWRFTQGRTLTHFHSFYNNGRELPTLARRESEPALWISPADADEAPRRRWRGNPHLQRGR